MPQPFTTMGCAPSRIIISTVEEVASFRIWQDMSSHMRGRRETRGDDYKNISTHMGRAYCVDKETSKRELKFDRKNKNSLEEEKDGKESTHSIDDDRRSEDEYYGGKYCDGEACAYVFPRSPSFKIYVTFSVPTIDDPIRINGRNYATGMDNYVENEICTIPSTSNNKMPNSTNSQPQESMSSSNSTKKGAAKSPKNPKITSRIGRVLAKRKQAASVRSILSIKGRQSPAPQNNHSSSTKFRFIPS